MNSQMKRHLGRGPEGSRAQDLLSPWSLSCTTLPAHEMLLFPNLEALWNPTSVILLEASLQSGLIIHLAFGDWFKLHPLSGGEMGEWEWKI